MERVIHNLIIGLYPPRGSGKAPMILSASVPEPSANHLREGIAGASNETIPGPILTYLAQAFQRCDEISPNKPTPAPEPAPQGIPLFQFSGEELLPVIDGTAYIAIDPESGAPRILPGEGPLLSRIHDDLVAIANGEKVVLLDDGHPVVVTPEEAAKLDLGQDGDTALVTGNPRISESGGEPISNAGIGQTDDGSAAGEKHLTEEVQPQG